MITTINRTGLSDWAKTLRYTPQYYDGWCWTFGTRFYSELFKKELQRLEFVNRYTGRKAFYYINPDMNVNSIKKIVDGLNVIEL